MANVSLLLRLENVGSGRCSFREGFSDLILLPAIDVPKEKALQRTYCSLAAAFPLHCSGLFLISYLFLPPKKKGEHSATQLQLQSWQLAGWDASLCKVCSSLQCRQQTPSLSAEPAS